MNAPLDMSQFTAAKSDQLGADDLLGREMTIKITKVSASPDAAEQPVNVFYEGDNGKPFRPCKTMRRLMVAAWGKYAEQYVGKSMTLYRDPDVKFGGMVVGGIRISAMSHIDGKLSLALMERKGAKKMHTVKPLQVADPAPAADDTRPDAEAFVAGYTAAIANRTTQDALARLQTKNKALLDGLAAFPDLAEQAANAMTERLAALEEVPE